MVVEHTGQQINDYCEKVLNLCLTCRNEGSLMFESVQIIRHLQTHIAAVTHIAEALAEDLPDDKRITLNRFRVQELVDILQLQPAGIE